MRTRPVPSRSSYDEGMDSIVIGGLVLLAALVVVPALAALAVAPGLLVSGLRTCLSGPLDTAAVDELDVLLVELAELTKP